MLLKNCRLLPELSGGWDREYADVRIGEGRILELLPAGTGHDEQYVDCGGRTLLPGLIDLHAHLNWDYHNGVIRMNDFRLLTNACLSAKRYLQYGYTTVRDMGAAKRVSVAVRNAVRQGLFVGPRILSGGMILRPRASVTEADPYNFLRYVSGVDEMTRFCREEIGEGADWIKLYLPGEPCEMLPEEVAAAVRIAHLRGKRVAAHSHDVDAIRICLQEGVDTVEHASFITAEQIAALKDSRTQHIVPTMTVLSERIMEPGFGGQEQKNRALKRLLEANARNIAAAYRAGLVMGWGTDTPIENIGDFYGEEFRMRKEYCGMDNVDMLLQATKYSALILGLQDETGEIREGLAADLVLVDGDPDRDIGVMYKKPLRVWRGGVLC